jgi:hypothetical protein
MGYPSTGGIVMDIYVIRNRHSKKYLPVPKGRNGRGGSHLEPTAEFRNARIMRSEKSAKSVLGMWLKGKFTASRYGYEDDFDEYIHLKPQEHRHREDMEIIKITILPPE